MGRSSLVAAKHFLGLIFINLIFAGCKQEKKLPDVTFVFDTLVQNRTVISGILIGGKKYGVWNDYYENGQLKFVETFTNDTLNGPWISYRDNGSIFTIGQYINNLKEGEWLHYDGYPNHIVMKRHYYKGKKVGIWEDYDERGHLQLKVKYGQNEKAQILIDKRLPIPDNPE